MWVHLPSGRSSAVVTDLGPPMPATPPAPPLWVAAFRAYAVEPRPSLARIVRLPLPACGLTHASRVIRPVRSSEARSGTVTQELLPLK